MVMALNNLTADGVQKSGILMHPPYKNGKTGFVFIEYEPIRLPRKPVVFKAAVGKRDRSDPGDGIVFRIEVREENSVRVAGEQTVKKHEWREISADLSRWAGKTVRLRLVSDPGPNGDTSGDWALWAEIKLFERDKKWTHRLSDEIDPWLREPGPYPAKNLTTEILRTAENGWLHYEGMGLKEGNGRPGSSAILNGTSIEAMATAAGNETLGKWAAAKIPLDSKSISLLKAVGNRFEIDNRA